MSGWLCLLVPFNRLLQLTKLQIYVKLRIYYWSIDLAENPDPKHRDLPVLIYADLFACKLSPEVTEDNYE